MKAHTFSHLFCSSHEQTDGVPCATGSGVARAQLATKVLYERDIAAAKADEVLVALRGNPVLHLCNPAEVMDAPLTKLAALHRVATSNSASSIPAPYRQASSDSGHRVIRL